MKIKWDHGQVRDEFLDHTQLLTPCHAVIDQLIASVQLIVSGAAYTVEEYERSKASIAPPLSILDVLQGEEHRARRRGDENLAHMLTCAAGQAHLEMWISKLKDLKRVGCPLTDQETRISNLLLKWEKDGRPLIPDSIVG